MRVSEWGGEAHILNDNSYSFFSKTRAPVRAYNLERLPAQKSVKKYMYILCNSTNSRSFSIWHKNLLWMESTEGKCQQRFCGIRSQTHTRTSSTFLIVYIFKSKIILVFLSFGNCGGRWVGVGVSRVSAATIHTCNSATLLYIHTLTSASICVNIPE